MKHIFTLLIALAAAATAFAGVITAVGNGNWATAAPWNLNRKPQNGDTIIIPAGINVAFTTTENLNGVVIQIWGTLSMSGGGKLNLDNAGLIQVFSGGMITGTGNSDQIKIGNTHVFKGASPPVVGSVYASNLTGGGFAPMSTLPVTFANFYVSRVNNDILIRWATATENNNNHFEVERSFDGRDWSTIATIAAVGNSSQLNQYSFTDKNMKTSFAYYRIKQVDNDGRFTFTVVRSIKNAENNNGIEIFAAKNKTVTILFQEMKSTASVKIFNLNGQAVMQQTYQQSAYITLRLGDAIPGVYVVHVTDENNQSQSKKIILN
ncbi:MAG TPA: T9SS type A sorting domain-containing protein [Chitinophagaceae bacterium]|nr:T9SS type A sorting domain-containing protein [Chitinophagaceae bacterium]